ncbi:MAG TPA: ABC transporter permease subunit [Pirellulales bacterium]
MAAAASGRRLLSLEAGRSISFPGPIEVLKPTMFIGPVVSLEMITSARRARYFIVRVLYALLLFVVLWINYRTLMSQRITASDGTMSTQVLAEFSHAFFLAFTVVQLGAVLMLTPAMIAGAIAQERERRTIEYLFASMLSGSEIVLSKYLARTLHVASLLVVGLPILAIAMMLGGIDPDRLIIVFTMTLATLVATASLSIATSVWAKRSRDAVLRTYVLLLAFLILPPLTWMLAASVGPSSWLDWLTELARLGTLANPFSIFWSLFGARLPGRTSPWQTVWPILAAYAAFSLVALAWSIVSVRRVYRKSMGAADSGPRRRKARFRWRPALRNRPMLWKELFATSAAFQLGWLGRIATILLMAGAIVPALLLFYRVVLSPHTVNDPSREVVGAATGMVATIGCGALLVVTIRAASSITAEREGDSWLTLVSTPLTPGDIVWGKIAGSIFAARWFAVPVGIWWAVATIIVPNFVLVLPIFVATFGCVALAMGAIGVWFSSWCRTSIRAMASAVAVGIFMGGGYLLCCIPLFFQGGEKNLILGLTPCIPFLLGAPGWLWGLFVHPSNGGLDAANVMMAYIFGTGFYLVLGMVVTVLTIGSFDRTVGRPSRSVIPGVGGALATLPPAWEASPGACSSDPAADTKAADLARGIGRANDPHGDRSGKG